MNKKLRIVIVGCGYFGQKRIQACIHLKNKLQIVAIIDTNKKRAQEVGNSLHLPYKTSLSEFLKSSTADIAIIAVPNYQHAAVVCEALKHGLHVLCEKPLSISFKEAKKIVLAAKKYKRFVKTGSNHRFFPTIQKAHDIITRGGIGNVLCIKGNIGTNGSHTKQSWFWDKKLSGGGTYIDNACHLLDITRWFMGNFSSCTGMIGNTYWKKTSVEDIAGGLYKTKDGRLAIITSSWTQWTGYLSLEIWGDKGYILIDSKQGDFVIVGNKQSTKKKVFDFSHKPLSSYEDELSYFVSCIQKKVEPRPNAADGAAVIHMIEGVYTSAKQKKLVQLSQTT
ncbi:MAG: Gfo/Idh/MocA family oxidoreductase [Microgenomates group bacterium]